MAGLSFVNKNARLFDWVKRRQGHIAFKIGKHGGVDQDRPAMPNGNRLDVLDFSQPIRLRAAGNEL